MTVPVPVAQVPQVDAVVVPSGQGERPRPGPPGAGDTSRPSLMAGQHVAHPSRGQIPDDGLTAVTTRDSETGAVGQLREGRIARRVDPIGGELGGEPAIGQAPDPHDLVGVEGDRDGTVPGLAGHADGAWRHRAFSKVADELSGPQIPQRDVDAVGGGQSQGRAVLVRHADDPARCHPGLLGSPRRILARSS